MQWPLITLGLTVLLIGGLLYVVLQLIGGFIKILSSKKGLQKKLSV
jgi:hypothetical protein